MSNLHYEIQVQLGIIHLNREKYQADKIQKAPTLGCVSNSALQTGKVLEIIVALVLLL